MEAIAALHEPHIKLLIVGSPFFARTQQSAFQRKLEQQAKSLGNRVQFTGYIPNEDLPDYYRLADLCCVPTLVEEAAGLVAVEAMACGRPVLATRSGGMPEYLAGSQAVLVERGDTVTDQLAWSIRMLYEHPALCTEMGAAGAAIGTLCCFAVVAIMDLFVIHRIIPAPPRMDRIFVKPLIASGFMALAAWACHGLLAKVLGLLSPFQATDAAGVVTGLTGMGNAIATLGGIGIGVVVYVVLIVALKAISKDDLSLMPKGDKLAKILRVS